MTKSPLASPAPLAALAALALLAGCAAQTPAARVTRFHLGQTIARGDIAIQPRQPGEDAGLDYQSYAAAVGRGLEGNGFRLSGDAKTAELIALIAIDRQTFEDGPPRAPASIGIGLGTGGGGFGIGGSVAIPVGKPRLRESVRTELSVQIRRRSDGSAIWEGRAQLAAPSGTPLAAPGPAVERLAAALFKGFPGESGKTITVK